MNVERQLQLCMAALAALGTLLLGLGQRDAWLPIAAAFAAITSVYIVDMRQWFSLNRNLANVAALIAVVVSVYEFRKAASEAQLLAIANLLIYLQLVLMYQVKTDRVYWQLVVLSLLQVVVAAALNLGFEFGVLLFVYLVVAVTAMFLFFIRRETRLFDAIEQQELDEWWAFGTPVRNESDRDVPEESLPPESASGFAQVALPDGPDDTPARPLPGWSMLREVTSLSLITLVFAAVLFYSVPRSADSGRIAGGGRGSVGFNPEVSLSDKDRILEDTRPALRISLADGKTGEPIVLMEPLYIRGAVDARYYGLDSPRSQRGWRTAVSNPAINSTTTFPLTGAALSDVVRLDITVESPDSSLLFGIFPVYDIAQSDSRVRYFPGNEQLRSLNLSSERDRRNSSFRYILGTTNIRNGKQNRFSAFHAMDSQPPAGPGLSERQRTLYLSIDPSAGLPEPDYGKTRARRHLPRLMALAEEIVKDKGIPSEHRLECCWAIEDHFRRSKNRYEYTLDFDKVKPNPNLDPNEYFVGEHHLGNCRYFASATALMLRSLGIESRVVVGFKGGEYNAVGGFSVIRQRDAHAWVEAYIPADQLPENALAEGESRAGGAWYRLDPTPDVDEYALTHLDHGPFAWLGQSLDYAQVIWNDYVVTLNSERQNEAIFRPLLDRTAGAVEKAFQAQTWRDIFAAVAGWLGLARDSWLVQYWYLWLGLVIVPLTVLAAWLAWLFSAPLVRLLFTGHWTDPSVKGPARSRVAFYARLEELLASAELVREPGQTPREFALALAANLAEVPFLRDVVPLVREVTEAYYRVRFGGEQLSWDQRAEIERDLLVLQRVLGAQLAPASS